MRCNSNCSCNQNSCNRRCNNGGNFQPYNIQPYDCGYNNNCHGMYSIPFKNQCNVFAARTTVPQTLTPPATGTTTPSPVILEEVLYDYGCAIQASNGSSPIRITEPGIYQVSYFVSVTTPAGSDPTTITTSIFRNTSQFAVDTALVGGATPSILTASDIFYVSCQDTPLTLTLRIASTAALAITYEFFITINRICSCCDAGDGSLGVNNNCCNGFPNYGYGCGCGCNSYFGDFVSGPMMPNSNAGCVNGLPNYNFRNDGNSSCNNNRNGNNSSCNNGCGCNS